MGTLLEKLKTIYGLHGNGRNSSQFGVAGLIPKTEFSEADVISTLKESGIPTGSHGIRQSEMEAQFDTIWGNSPHSEEE